MKTLTVEIPDELYAAFAQMAVRDGRTVQAVALECLAKHEPRPRPQLTEEERQAARETLRRYAGCVDSGDPRSADNERIDADLAKEYASSHEEDT